METFFLVINIFFTGGGGWRMDSLEKQLDPMGPIASREGGGGVPVILMKHIAT